MSESTLSISYSELRRRIGRYLGFSRDPDDWDSDESEDVADVLLSGLRQFYAPPIEHDWSFLKPVRELSLVAGDDDYDMPDDFASLVGDCMTFPSDTQALFVRITGEQMIRQLRQSGVSTGRPQYVAIVPTVVSTPASEGQRFEAQFWPTPDQSYTLEYKSEIIPYSLVSTETSSRIHPYGGAVHAETILQSCKAAAELHMNRERGVEWEAFLDRLKASIRKDIQLSPRYHGYNGNLSHGLSTGRNLGTITPGEDLTWHSDTPWPDWFDRE